MKVSKGECGLKRRMLCVLCVVLIMLTLSKAHVPTAGVDGPLNSVAAMPTLQYVTHEPISIVDNADFTALGFPGDGSPSNPYIIEGLNITSATHPLIHIQNTTAYFCIRNNYLNGLTDEYGGISLKQVTHGTIDTNIVTHCLYGILLGWSENNTVSNNTVSNCEHGIDLGFSRNNTLANNTISNNKYGGIAFLASGQNSLLDNRLVNNGLSIVGDQVEHYLQAKVAGNVVNGRPLVYWQNVIGGTVPPGAGQVILINTTGVEVTGQDLVWISIDLSAAFGSGLFATFSSNLNIHHNTGGITLGYSVNCTVSHNTGKGAGISLSSSRQNNISYNIVEGAGIHLEYSGQNTLSHNSISNCGFGILLITSGQNALSYNSISNCVDGIRLMMSSGQNTLSHNSVSNNSGAGIRIFGSENNTLSHNSVSNNSGAGIDLLGSENNTVSNNTISNNSGYGIVLGLWNNTVKWNDFLGNNPGGRSQARDDGTNNAFVHNYWDDHDTTDQNGDGIADAPYPIDGSVNNQDQSPLALPANSILTETTTTSSPLVGSFPTPGRTVDILLATLLLVMIPVKRIKRKTR